MTDNEQRQWNRLWEMYGSGALRQADHTAYLLCEYDSGINGEGHSGWFFNHRVRLPEWIAKYQSVLPKAFYANLCMAYESCGTDREDAHRKIDPIVEDIVNRIGKEYIDHISDHD